MSSIDHADDEKRRLAALLRYDVLDTEAEDAFDRASRLTCKLLRTPMAAVSFLDASREWFKSRIGLLPGEAPRETSLGEQVIREAGPLVARDAQTDDRLADCAAVIGPPHIRFYAGAPLRTSEGCDIGTIAAMDTEPRELVGDAAELLTEMSRIVVQELELRRLAIDDDLSGAMSRPDFLAEARRDFALARRHKQELSCIVFDIDHLRRDNETFGREACDDLIREALALARRGLRSSDYVGRLSGDQFAIMLPQTSARSAMRVAERLRKTVERQEALTRTGPLKLTASFGIASADDSVADIGALLRRGDVALYGAKSAGRNRCINFATQHLRSIDRVA